MWVVGIGSSIHVAPKGIEWVLGRMEITTLALWKSCLTPKHFMCRQFKVLYIKNIKETIKINIIVIGILSICHHKGKGLYQDCFRVKTVFCIIWYIYMHFILLGCCFCSVRHWLNMTEWISSFLNKHTLFWVLHHPNPPTWESLMEIRIRIEAQKGTKTLWNLTTLDHV